MKKLRIPLFAAVALVAASASVLSCKKDDDDVEIIQSLAGDYVGGEDCTTAPDPSSAQSEYVVRINNTADNSQVFIENYGDINYRITDGANNPHEKFAVTLQNNAFMLPATTRTIRLYEASSLANVAATASATAKQSLDLRTLITYTLTADGKVEGDSLKMNYEISNSTATRFKLIRKAHTPATQPKDSVVVDAMSSGTNELDVKCTFKGNREFKAPIVQGG